MVEVTGSDKHCSLLGQRIDNSRGKFYNRDPGKKQVYYQEMPSIGSSQGLLPTLMKGQTREVLLKGKARYG
jgi:hypothetical protein